MSFGWRKPFLLLLIPLPFFAQEAHVHEAPQRLGVVSFPTSCMPSVQQEFSRGVALIHSFAYTAAEEAFRSVARQDSGCAMAHWGIAMTNFHPLWEPPIAPDSRLTAGREIELASHIGAGTERERKFIHAANLIFQEATVLPYSTRALDYEQAMGKLAADNKTDTEAQVFYALALLANASPADSSHSRQKQAVALLQPLYRSYPQHPGIAHYLIHACDNTEMAAQGLEAARAYSKIAPSAPHALHMPSHIFTRLGLWEDSIASNIAAREAARRGGDRGEELHAMDYLVYAYLQLGRDADAARVIEELHGMPARRTGDFKTGYASTAMPIRYVVERHQWRDLANISPPIVAPPPVIAIAVWARGLGLGRTDRAHEVQQPIEDLQHIEEQLRSSGNVYWATQVLVMKYEVMAWSAQGQGDGDKALTLLRQAAAEEESIEKLPVTPGPIVPARELLGQLLLEQGRPNLAAKEFEAVLAGAPGRRGALQGAAEAVRRLRQN